MLAGGFGSAEVEPLDPHVVPGDRENRSLQLLVVCVDQRPATAEGTALADELNPVPDRDVTHPRHVEVGSVRDDDPSLERRLGGERVLELCRG